MFFKKDVSHAHKKLILWLLWLLLFVFEVLFFSLSLFWEIYLLEIQSINKIFQNVFKIKFYPDSEKNKIVNFRIYNLEIRRKKQKL